MASTRDTSRARQTSRCSQPGRGRLLRLGLCGWETLRHGGTFTFLGLIELAREERHRRRRARAEQNLEEAADRVEAVGWRRRQRPELAEIYLEITVR
jgi:hypothetical protein